MRRSLGIAIVGGLVVSQVLTLYTTPVVFLYVEKLRGWWQRRAFVVHAAPSSAAA
jgi:multidrug efflux pump